MFDDKADKMKLNLDPNEDGVSDGDFQKYLSEENEAAASHDAGAGALEDLPTEKLDEQPPVKTVQEESETAAPDTSAPATSAGDTVKKEDSGKKDSEKNEKNNSADSYSEKENSEEESADIETNKDTDKESPDEEDSDHEGTDLKHSGEEEPDEESTGTNVVTDGGKGAQKRERKKKKKKKKRTKWFWIRLIVIIAAIIALLIGGLYYAFYYGAGLVQMQRVDSKTFGDELYINDWVSSNKDMDGYTNIALFGVDSRDDDLLGGNNRSDIIMIVSIHNRTGKVKIVSLYRDTYINVGYGEYDKANTAYAYGGPMQAVNMMNMNLDLNITDFATFGFKGVIDAIDELGGVDIDVQEEEVEYINMYLQTMHDEIGSENNPISGAGMQHLDGAQATAYSRIRYTQGGDFHRTERQREVLQQIFQKASKCGPKTLIDVCNSLSGEVATSLSNTEIMELIVRMLFMKIDDTSGFPIEEYREPATLRGRSIVIPETLTDNVKWLHGYLFGEEPYYTSELVDEISDMIDRKTTYAIADDDPILQDMKEDDSASEHSTVEPSVDLGNTGNTAQTSEEAYTGSSQ